jgi:hypothetical protein
MTRIIETILLLTLLATISATGRADDCFCLTHADGGIVRGCEAKGATILCTDPDTNKKSVQKISPDWKRIEAGTNRCEVCAPTARGTSTELPRGKDDAKKQPQ